MGMYLIGEVIKHFRKQKRLSQEELSLGIMDAASLSKIERGHAMPSKKNIEALFEKLGININDFSSILLTNELREEQKIIDKLGFYLTSRDTKKAASIITKLEKDKKFTSDKLNIQFLLAAKAANAMCMNKNPKEVFGILHAGIKDTGLELSEANVKTYLLTRIAFKMFNMLAVLYFEQGEHDKAIAIWHGLKQNIEINCVSIVEKGQRYSQVIACLAKAFNLLGRHEEVIRTCLDGKRTCIETRSLRLLPEIAFYEARSRFELGDIKTCKKLICEAYHTFSLYEQYHDMEETKKYAHDKLGIFL